MLNLAYNSNGFLNKGLEETIDILQNIGYKAIEVALDRNHLDPTYHSDHYLNTLMQKLEKNDFKIVSLHTGGKNINSEIDFEPSLISNSKRDRQKRINFIIEAINLAKVLNVKMVTITSGIQRENVDQKMAKKFLHESIDQILSHADGKVDILIENEIGMYICTTEDVINLLEYYPNNLWVTFDIGHSFCCNEDICESIDKLNGKIKHMHFEDILNRIHKHLLPGEGEIDFEKVVKKLENSNYDGFCSVELYTYNHAPEQAAQKSYDYLKSLN